MAYYDNRLVIIASLVDEVGEVKRLQRPKIGGDRRDGRAVLSSE